MADVSGHGVPVATCCIDSQNSIWISRVKYRISGSDLLKSMNEILRDKTGGEFVTACYAYTIMNKNILVLEMQDTVLFWILENKKDYFP